MPQGRLLGLVVALVLVAAGIGLMVGLLQHQAPAHVRIGCGVILVLLGVNRWLVTRIKSRPERRRHFLE